MKKHQREYLIDLLKHDLEMYDLLDLGIPKEDIKDMISYLEEEKDDLFGEFKRIYDEFCNTYGEEEFYEEIITIIANWLDEKKDQYKNNPYDLVSKYYEVIALKEVKV